jgi:hypothetical protein
MSLLSAGDVASIRGALDVTLTHRCTLQRMAPGVEDEEYNTPTVPDGSPEYSVPCRYETRQVARRDEGGVTLVIVPSLTVSATLSLPIGTEVSAITDSMGGTPPGADGTFRVERVLDDTAGLGAALLPVYELRGAKAVS